MTLFSYQRSMELFAKSISRKERSNHFHLQPGKSQKSNFQSRYESRRNLNRSLTSFEAKGSNGPRGNQKARVVLAGQPKIDLRRVMPQGPKENQFDPFAQD